uniref:Ribosomal protein S1 n=1 Tax=Ophidocladus simpliciusculus TaxID=1261574 RepID=A0A1Z1MK07_9FLOR|nr:ribosomal protein S1 [Ophidocladus simpliciusculus]ARW66084.1 ribosomal protein S1 [Ophidocladus simpliciusculus]
MNIQKRNINKFADILKKYKYNLHAGDIVAGTIIYQEYLGFLVNIGTSLSGFLPKEEITLISHQTYNNNQLLVNTTREFFLIKKNTSTNQGILSIKRLEYIRAWKRIKQLYLEDILFNLQIKYVNKGGIITYLEGIQGFIPKSHINQKQNNYIRKESKNSYIICKLLTINEQKNQLILSNKRAIYNLLKHKFKLGELLYGKVIIIKSYGLFLTIYGVKALLHISEIELKQIKKADLFFKIGKLIKVKIIHINNKQGQLSLSQRNIKST